MLQERLLSKHIWQVNVTIKLKLLFQWNNQLVGDLIAHLKTLERQFKPWLTGMQWHTNLLCTIYAHICNAFIQHDKLDKTRKELEKASRNIELVEPSSKSISICQSYVVNQGEQLGRVSKRGGSWKRGQFSQHSHQVTADQVVTAGITNNNSNRNDDREDQDSWSTKRSQGRIDSKPSKIKTDDKTTPTPLHCYKCGKIGYVRLKCCSKFLGKAQSQ